MICPVCNIIGAQIIKDDVNFSVGGVKIEGSYYTECNACGEEYYNPEQIQRTERLIKEQIHGRQGATVPNRS